MINRFSPRLSSLLVLSVVAVSGCTTSTQFVDYKQQRLYSGETMGGMNYVEIGPAVGRARGYVWESCDKIQQEALEELRDETQQHGANSVFDVRWVNHAEGSLDETPLCTTRWGWFVGFGVAGLAPWVKVTEVRGKLAYVDSAARDELNASADSYQAQLKEQARQKDEKPAPDVDSANSDKEGDSPASDADSSDSEKTGEDAVETSAAADEAETSEESSATDAESSSETPDSETGESSEESDAQAETDADAQDETGQDDNSNADEQSSSS